jgi:hypothetical protein
MNRSRKPVRSRPQAWLPPVRPGHDVALDGAGPLVWRGDTQVEHHMAAARQRPSHDAAPAPAGVPAAPHGLGLDLLPVAPSQPRPVLGAHIPDRKALSWATWKHVALLILQQGSLVLLKTLVVSVVQ